MLLILTAFTVGVDTRQDIPVVVHDTKRIGHWSYNHILKPTGHAIDKAYHAKAPTLGPADVYGLGYHCANNADMPPAIVCSGPLYDWGVLEFAKVYK